MERCARPYDVAYIVNLPNTFLVQTVSSFTRTEKLSQVFLCLGEYLRQESCLFAICLLRSVLTVAGEERKTGASCSSLLIAGLGNCLRVWDPDLRPLRQSWEFGLFPVSWVSTVFTEWFDLKKKIHRGASGVGVVRPFIHSLGHSSQPDYVS